MPFEFQVPTLARLVLRAKSDIETALDNGAAFLRFTVEHGLAHAVAGLAHGLHGHLRTLARQLLPDSAEGVFLDRHARLWLGEDNTRKAASRAELILELKGSAGATLGPSSPQWRRSDGTLYEVIGNVTLDEMGGGTVPVRAVEPGGAGNTTPGSILVLTASVAGVEPNALVSGDPAAGPTGSGADQETDPELRTRVLERIQDPPRGGGKGDYVAWAKELSGVTRAWQVPRLFGPGTVTVMFVRDGDTSPFPDASAVAGVQTHIDEVAPTTAVVHVLAPTPRPLNPQIQLGPNTAEVQAAVTAQLQDLILRRASPGATLLVSQIREAISLAAGENDHVLIDPSSNVEPQATELVTLGTPQYVPIGG